MKRFPIIILCLSTFLLCACGGGGGGGTSGGGGGGTEGAGAAQPTTAILHLSTTYNNQGAVPTGEPIRAVTVTVNLPPGVNMKENGLKSSTTTASKTALPQVMENVKSTATVGGKVTLVFLTDPVGFGIGEFATLECTVATGSFPKAINFSLSNPTVTDLSFNTNVSLDVSFAADIQ